MITDFGLSKMEQNGVMSTACGTPGYVGESRGDRGEPFVCLTTGVVLAFCCCDKHHEQMRKGLVSYLTVHHEGKSGQETKAQTWR